MPLYNYLYRSPSSSGFFMRTALLLLCFFPAFVFAQSPAQADTLYLKKLIQTLCDSSFQGRAPGGGAQQKVIAAKGQADSAIESATGAAKSAVIQAEADKTKQVLDGEGQAARLKLEISAFNNSPDLYIRYLQARAQLQWNGQSPQVVGGSGSQQAIVVPITGTR